MKAKTRKGDTIKDYRGSIDRDIVPRVGIIAVVDLTPTHIDNMVSSIQGQRHQRTDELRT